MEIHGGFIGACTTTEEELVLGGLVLEQMLAAAIAAQTDAQPPGGARRSGHPGPKLREAGLLAAYERAGFRIGPPGCSMCLGIASETRGRRRGLAHQPEPQLRKPHGQGLVRLARLGRHRRRLRAGLAVTDPRPWLAQVDQDRFRRILRRGRTSTSPRS
jgi:hypothetical protein